MNVIPLDTALLKGWQPFLGALPLWIRECAAHHALRKAHESASAAAEIGAQVLSAYNMMPLWVFNTARSRQDAIGVHQQYGAGGMWLLARKRVRETTPHVAVLYSEPDLVDTGAVIKQLADQYGETPLEKLYCTSQMGAVVRQWAIDNGVGLICTLSTALLIAPWKPTAATVGAIPGSALDNPTLDDA